MEWRLQQSALPNSMAVREAALTDMVYIDSLQKKHGEQLGFMAWSWIRAAIIDRHCWVGTENGEPACYVLGKPRYKDQYAVGIIYQACVQYDAQRRTLGFALVQAFLGAMAISTEQLVLWCAQDIEANLFWNACGFKALAWRVGGKKATRIHICWSYARDPDKPLDQHWFPESTTGGSMKAWRRVQKLEPGESWVDPKRVHDALIVKPGNQIVTPGDQTVLVSTNKKPPRAVAPTRQELFLTAHNAQKGPANIIAPPPVKIFTPVGRRLLVSGSSPFHGFG